MHDLGNGEIIRDSAHVLNARLSAGDSARAGEDDGGSGRGPGHRPLYQKTGIQRFNWIHTDPPHRPTRAEIDEPERWPARTGVWVRKRAKADIIFVSRI